MTHFSKVWRTPGALLLAASISLAAGCGGQSADQQAMSDAAKELGVLGLPGSNPSPVPDQRKKKLQAIIASLKPVADNGGNGGSAAHLLIARAQAGLAEAAAHEAAEAESAAGSQLTTVRLGLDRWLSQRSIAAALESYDATAQIAEIDQKIAQREQQAAELMQAKQAAQGVLDGIMAKAKQARDQATAKREAEAAIRARTAGATQTQIAELVIEARQVKREGDAYEKEAGEFEANASREKPKVDAFSTQIEQITKEVSLLRDGKQALTTKAAKTREQAVAATQEASKTAEEVVAQLRALEEARKATDGPTEEALKNYRSAIATVKKATYSGNDGQATSKVAGAGYQQSLGDVLFARANGVKAYADLLAALQAAKMPGAAGEALAQTQTAAKEAFEAARREYEGARQQFSGNLRLPETAKRILERVDAQLKALSGVVDEPPAGEPAPEKPSDEAPTTEPAPAEAPKPAAPEGGSGG